MSKVRYTGAMPGVVGNHRELGVWQPGDVREVPEAVAEDILHRSPWLFVDYAESEPEPQPVRGEQVEGETEEPVARTPRAKPTKQHD